MRSFLVLIAGLLLAFGTQLKADSEFEEEEEELVSSEVTDAAAPADTGGWNRWICKAKAGFIWSYKGESFYFRPTSGENLEAKRFARLVAERNCEFKAKRSCASRESDCQMERH